MYNIYPGLQYHTSLKELIIIINIHNTQWLISHWPVLQSSFYNYSQTYQRLTSSPSSSGQHPYVQKNESFFSLTAVFGSKLKKINLITIWVNLTTATVVEYSEISWIWQILIQKSQYPTLDFWNKCAFCN